MQVDQQLLTQPPLSLFDDLSSLLIQNLPSQPVEAQCFVQISKIFPPQSLTETFFGSEVLLQIVGEQVIQRCPSSAQIISAFKCDYEIQFEILRKISPIGNKLGDPLGLRFIFKNNANKSIEFSIKPEHRKDLEKFGRILGRKFIVQLGFHTSFKAIKKIGKGMTACVYNALNFATGKEVAIKSFKRSVYFATDNNNGKISFQKEFKILTQIVHKNICQFHSVYETENSTYVILELLPLSLYGYLQKFGFPSEAHSKTIMINLLEGIGYLHARGIMHRDLKLENIMVKKDESQSGHVIPVIVDLGLAEYTNAEKYLYTRCGTPGYVAPEVLRIKSADPIQTYTSACDVFSLGVIFHILLFKKPLFEGKDVKEVIKKNCECVIDFDSEYFISLSNEGRNFFEKLLARDPQKRMTANEALAHSYLASEKKQETLPIQTSSSILNEN